MIDRFKKAKKIKLSSLIPSVNFRTVNIELHNLKCGITEIPVTIEYNKNYKSTYEELLAGGCFIHGFVKMNEELEKINGSMFRKRDGSDLIKRIYITDWDGAFLLSIALNKGGEYSYAVTNEEVDDLVKNCLHPNN